MFFVFGDRQEAPGELTLAMKLPISVGMVQGRHFVRESMGWRRQHDWVIAGSQKATLSWPKFPH